MASVLSQIVTQRRKDVRALKTKTPLAQLLQQYESNTQQYSTINVVKRLRQAGDIALMAEIKKASPSKGKLVHEGFNFESQVLDYIQSGVAVVSVLTEPKWFEGSIDDLKVAKKVIESTKLGKNYRPAVLRKDFIIDEYQIYEAVLNGADTLLLIVAAFQDGIDTNENLQADERPLDIPHLNDLINTCRKIGIEPLVEVANETELQTAISLNAKLIGINNRNLHNLDVDTQTTSKLLETIDPILRKRTIFCALSGIQTREDVLNMEASHVNAILVGEAMMLSPYAPFKARQLLGAIRLPPPLVKICGVKDPMAAANAVHARTDFIGLVFAPHSHRKVNINTAQDIVRTIREIRSDKDNVKLTPPSHLYTNNPTRWFGRWYEILLTEAHQKKPLIVGVFANQSPKEINEIATQVGLDIIQLSGTEKISSADEYVKPVFKAIHVSNEDKPDDIISTIKQYVGVAAAILLDTKDPTALGGTGKAFDWSIAREIARHFPIGLAGGLNLNNVSVGVLEVRPFIVDVSSGVETCQAKDPQKVNAFIEMAKFPFDPLYEEKRNALIQKHREEIEAKVAKDSLNGYFPGRFGDFGGRFVPETLVEPLEQLEKAYWEAKHDPAFHAQVTELYKHYVHRPTPLYYARELTNLARERAKKGEKSKTRSNLDINESEYAGEEKGARIWLKREDLTHTGSHKINNAISQALLAMRLGKRRIIAETGAGQHGVATATVCAMLGLQCVVYMGSDDIKRQSLNVFRMKTLGTTVVPVESGSRTLKDAINEALRDWVTNVETTHYLIGSAIGPHPFPTIVRDFQSVIGKEAKKQILTLAGKLPDCVIACVGGGSNSIGTFHPFLNDPVRILGVEAGGHGVKSDHHSATLGTGQPGVLHGTKTMLMQDEHGQVLETHSISAGLDYPGVGPEHSFLQYSSRVEYVSATDQEALEGFSDLAIKEGILPALESSHAIYEAIYQAQRMRRDQDILVCLSGRGDKDMITIASTLNYTL